MEQPHLILVPGLLCDEALWDPQLRLLSDISWMTVGDTSLDDNFPEMAARILASAPDRFSLAGLSMGGYVCMEIMAQDSPGPGMYVHLAQLLSTQPL